MDTWLIAVVVIAALGLAGLAAWLVSGARGRKLEEARSLAAQHRERAEHQALRAHERERTAREELDRAERERAAAHAHARRAEDIDPDAGETRES
jgi:Flp pilus assembly protein TadB